MTLSLSNAIPFGLSKIQGHSRCQLSIAQQYPAAIDSLVLHRSMSSFLFLQRQDLKSSSFTSCWPVVCDCDEYCAGMFNAKISKALSIFSSLDSPSMTH